MDNEQIIGLAWYYKEQWDKVRANSIDRDDLEEKYEEWKTHALDVASKMRADGFKVHRVFIDVEMLLAWCNKKGIPIDGYARSTYTNYLMASHFGNNEDI